MTVEEENSELDIDAMMAMLEGSMETNQSQGFNLSENTSLNTYGSLVQGDRAVPWAPYYYIPNFPTQQPQSALGVTYDGGELNFVGTTTNEGYMASTHPNFNHPNMMLPLPLPVCLPSPVLNTATIQPSTYRHILDRTHQAHPSSNYLFKLHKLPSKLFAYFNQGNVDKMRNLLKEYMDVNCDCMCSLADYVERIVGPDNYTDYLSRLIVASPDCSIQLRSTVHRDQHGMRLLITKHEFTGTIVDLTAVNNLFGGSINALFADISGHLDTEFVTESQREHMKSIEQSLRFEKQMISITVDVKTIYAFDKKTGKMIHLIEKYRMKSFKGMNPK